MTDLYSMLGTPAEVAVPAGRRGAAPGEMIICLVDGSAVVVDPGDTGVDDMTTAMRVPGPTGAIVTVFNVRTRRHELLRSTAIVRLILPEDIG